MEARPLRRSLPLGLLLGAIAAIWLSGLADHLSWAELARNQAKLTAWVEGHPVAAPILYAVLYVLVTALAIPEAAVVTVAGGLLFGTFLGLVLTVVGATLGAILLFAAARFALAGVQRRSSHPLLRRIRQGLQRDGFSYLLAVRLIPIFPFWAVNLAAAFGGMRLGPYAAATFIGIIPGTAIFASIGAGIGGVLARGERPDLTIVLAPQILGPLVGLAILALLPVAWKRWKGIDA